MKFTPIDTNLNLPYITWLLKALYNSDIPVYSEGTSHVPDSKLFLPCNLVLSMKNDSMLSSNYYNTGTFVKRIKLFVYEDSTRFDRNNKNANYNILFSLIIFIDLEKVWVYKEGEDTLTLKESNYKVFEETDHYRTYPLGGNYDDTYPMCEQKGVAYIDSWFEANKEIILNYLRK